MPSTYRLREREQEEARISAYRRETFRPLAANALRRGLQKCRWVRLVAVPHEELQSK